MRSIYLPLLVVLLIVHCYLDLLAQHFYNSDGAVSLSIDSSKVLLKLDPNASPEVQQSTLSSIGRIAKEVEPEVMIDSFVVCSLSSSENYTGFLDSLDAVDGVYLVEPYYTLENGEPMLVGETFVVAHDLSLSTDEIDSINASHGVVIDHLIYGFESVYLLKNTDSSGTRVLDLANMYYDMAVTHFAHPNFLMPAVKHNYMLYDYYHGEQNHLKKVIGVFNSNSVWDFAGLEREVVVAVIDDGIHDDAHAHEDLPASKVLPGYDFVQYDSDPEPNRHEAHGMACAGIIAALHTTDTAYQKNDIPLPNTGMFSMNHTAQILPIRILEDLSTTNVKAAEGLNYACSSGAEVLSCSWGNADGTSFPVIDSAILNNYYYGRNGLGSPMIFASGNYGEVYEGTVAYPASSPYTFAVGAIRLDDSLWDYSQYGDELDCVAPSGDVNFQGDVWTLDGMGYYYGYNPYITAYNLMLVSWDCPPSESNDLDYNCNFGGTSAAAPIVAGIASLLIARDSTLPVDSIYKILRESAVTDFVWGSIDAPDEYYGYGRVDAYRAMLAITRGDANNDGRVNVGDAVHIINYVFKGGAAP